MGFGEAPCWWHLLSPVPLCQSAPRQPPPAPCWSWGHWALTLMLFSMFLLCFPILILYPLQDIPFCIQCALQSAVFLYMVVFPPEFLFLGRPKDKLMPFLKRIIKEVTDFSVSDLSCMAGSYQLSKLYLKKRKFCSPHSLLCLV